MPVRGDDSANSTDAATRVAIPETATGRTNGRSRAVSRDKRTGLCTEGLRSSRPGRGGAQPSQLQPSANEPAGNAGSSPPTMTRTRRRLAFPRSMLDPPSRSPGAAPGYGWYFAKYAGKTLASLSLEGVTNGPTRLDRPRFEPAVNK